MPSVDVHFVRLPDAHLKQEDSKVARPCREPVSPLSCSTCIRCQGSFSILLNLHISFPVSESRYVASLTRHCSAL